MASDTSLRALWAVARSSQPRLFCAISVQPPDSSAPCLLQSPLTNCNPDKVIWAPSLSWLPQARHLQFCTRTSPWANCKTPSSDPHIVLMTPSAHRIPWAQSSWPQCHPDCILHLSALPADNREEVYPFFGTNSGTLMHLHSDLQHKDMALQTEKGERQYGLEGGNKWNLFYLKESEYRTKLIHASCWRTGKIKGTHAVWKCTSFTWESWGYLAVPNFCSKEFITEPWYWLWFFRHFAQTFNWSQWNMEITTNVLIN